MAVPRLRRRLRLGKYLLQERLGAGAFAEVWKAVDTIEDVRVALKVPHRHLLTPELLDAFKREVRLVARLEHPNILRVKSADLLEGLLVISQPLGETTLADRMERRLTLPGILDIGEQILQGLAHAHGRKIIHCDVKPENVILFPDSRVRLCDFGISRVSHVTQMSGSGSGTVGYVAPEQALGQPSFRSDVFSVGLILYEMLTSHLPRWPFTWPPPGHARLRQRLAPALVQVLRRALDLDSRRRFKDAGAMLRAFRPARAATLRRLAGQRTVRRTPTPTADWRAVRWKQCVRRFGRVLGLRHECSRCRGPVAETMLACPWCGASRRCHRAPSSFPAVCPRCGRGRKLDWRFCGFCFGAGFRRVAARRYPDRRYQGHCGECRGDLMPFQRYCPWCRRKVRQAWQIPGSRRRCSSCGWGVLAEFWDFCPWCSRKQARR